MAERNQELPGPKRFRQNELAGMMMPGPDPAYLETARQLARTAALSEALSMQVNAYPLTRELSIIHLSYLREHLDLHDQVEKLANQIGADPDEIVRLARAEVERLASPGYRAPDSVDYAEAKMIIRGPAKSWEEAA